MADDEHQDSHSSGGHGGGGGYAMEEEHEEGVAEWMISFADNALLQMGIFVILLAINMKEGGGGSGGRPSEEEHLAEPSVSMLDGAIAIRQAFNNPVNLTSTSSNDLPLIRRIIQRREGTAVEDGPPGDKHNVETVRPSDYKRMGGVIFFEENSGALDHDAEEVIKAMATQFVGRPTILEIRGHTSMAEVLGPLDGGMKLSVERSLAVRAMLISAGLSPSQLRPVQVGASDRASPDARSRGKRSNNQRVEIIVTDEFVPDDPYSVDPASR